MKLSSIKRRLAAAVAKAPPQGARMPGAAGAKLKAALRAEVARRKAHPEAPVRQWTNAELNQIAARSDDPIGADLARRVLAKRKGEPKP
jgi:hypothetical protein